MRLPRRRHRTLPLLALIAGLLFAIWAVHWYFFQLPARTSAAASASLAPEQVHR